VAGKPGVVGYDLAAGTHSLSQDWGHLSTLGGAIIAQPVIDSRLSIRLGIDYYANSRVVEHAKDFSGKRCRAVLAGDPAPPFPITVGVPLLFKRKSG